MTAHPASDRAAFNTWLVTDSAEPEFTHVSLRGGRFQAGLPDPGRSGFDDLTAAYIRVLEAGTHAPALSERVDPDAFPVLVDLDLSVSDSVSDSVSARASSGTGAEQGHSQLPSPEMDLLLDPLPGMEQVPEHAVTHEFLRAAVEAYRGVIASMCVPEQAARTRASEAVVMQRPAPYYDAKAAGVEGRRAPDVSRRAHVAERAGRRSRARSGPGPAPSRRGRSARRGSSCRRRS